MGIKPALEGCRHSVSLSCSQIGAAADWLAGGEAQRLLLLWEGREGREGGREGGAHMYTGGSSTLKMLCSNRKIKQKHI